MDRLELRVRAEMSQREGKFKRKQPEAKIVPLFTDPMKEKKK